MHNYESNSLKEYARELRARVRSVLPEGAVILCDKGNALYFVRLPKRNCCGGERSIEDNLCCESADKIRFEELLKRELMQIGFDCVFSNGAVLISPRAELMIEFERRFAPHGFLSRSLERFRGVNSAGRNADSKAVSREEVYHDNFPNNSMKADCSADARAVLEGEVRCANFGSDSGEMTDHADSKFVSTGEVCCANRANGFAEASSPVDSGVSTGEVCCANRPNGFAEASSPVDSGVSAGKICCEMPPNSSAKTVGCADSSGNSAYSAGILLFSEGLKRIEQPEPSKVKTYSRRAREFAAVGLRTGCGMGCYACARIAEEIERWI